MELKDYFKEEPKGSINEMAHFLSVTPTWLSLIIHGHRKPSPKLAVSIEKATQGLVLRKDLRPDLFFE
jgi:DNA-binding transcriptional regulator YdaS (Cro superfamily)